MNSNGFPLFHNRYCVLLGSRSGPKFAIWCSKIVVLLFLRCHPKRPFVAVAALDPSTRGWSWPLTSGPTPNLEGLGGWQDRMQVAGHEPQAAMRKLQLHTAPAKPGHGPTTSDKPAATGDQPPATTHQPPAANNQRQATYAKQPATSQQPPAASD